MREREKSDRSTKFSRAGAEMATVPSAEMREARTKRAERARIRTTPAVNFCALCRAYKHEYLPRTADKAEETSEKW